MKVTIVFESMFGNTERLADAVAVGLRARGAEVALRQAGDRDDHLLAGCDLLVLAAPTHALSLSRPASRAEAVTRGADQARATAGVREWLAAVDDPTSDADHPPVAVFDTRARIARHLPGSAARTTARAMRRKGYTVVAGASFYVDDVKGPLLPGELDRARAWGRTIAAHARCPVAPHQAG